MNERVQINLPCSYMSARHVKDGIILNITNYSKYLIKIWFNKVTYLTPKARYFGELPDYPVPRSKPLEWDLMGWTKFVDRLWLIDDRLLQCLSSFDVVRLVFNAWFFCRSTPSVQSHISHPLPLFLRSSITKNWEIVR